MTILDSIRRIITPIHPEGYMFIIAGLVLGVFLQWIWVPLGVLALLFSAYCAYFFRDPARTTPMREGLIVAPADGRITAVDEATPPPELGLGIDPMPRISIFLSVFDVHVNRAPMAGRIATVAYRPGKFLNADLDKASEDNERNGLVIESAGVRLGVVQIAGMIARRIVCSVKEGDLVGAGERFGIIRFGSRVDVYMPANAKPVVAVGQRAVGGETILADMELAESKLTFRVD